MIQTRTAHIMKIVSLCIIAAAANFGLSTLFVNVLQIPLFVDTVFTSAVCFTAGLLPGLFTALLTQIATGIRENSVTPFILCSFAEVLLICRLNPASAQKKLPDRGLVRFSSETTLVSIFAGLLLLYIVSCIVISVLGGLIDFVYHSVLLQPKLYFSAEDTFKIGLIRVGIPTPVMDIFSRIPVNLVDRFIVIFGGFFVSRGLRRLVV